MTFKPYPKALPRKKDKQPLKKKYTPIDELSKTVAFIKERMMQHKGYLYCERCGSQTARECADYNNAEPVFTTLKPHHIIYRSEKPKHKFLHHPLNILLVFQSCHDYYHSSKGNRNSLVEERRLNELFGEDVLNKGGLTYTRDEELKLTIVETKL